MSTQWCSHPSWISCREGYGPFAGSIASIIITYAYLGFLFRYAKRAGRFVLIRRAVVVTSTAHLAFAFVDRYAQEERALIYVLTIIERVCSGFYFSMWMYNILVVTFSALRKGTKSPRWIFASVWGVWILQSISVTVISTSIFLTGEQCISWILAGRVHTLVSVITLVIPLLSGYFILAFLVRRHTQSVQELYPDMDIETLLTAKHKIGKITLVTLIILIVWLGSMIASFESLKSDPYGTNEACVVPRHAIEVFSRLIQFNAALIYTHVCEPSTETADTSLVSTKNENVSCVQMSRAHVDSINCTRAISTGAQDLLRQFNDGSAKDTHKEYTDSITADRTSKPTFHSHALPRTNSGGECAHA